MGQSCRPKWVKGEKVKDEKNHYEKTLRAMDLKGKRKK